MWTQENRQHYNRDSLRYPSDLTDDEWSRLEPLIPPAKRGGGPREVDIREVVNGVMYVLSTGCQWRAIPKDLPPRSTVHGYFQRWDYDGTLRRIHHTLYQQCREQMEREPSPTACVIDSQSVKGAEKGGPASIRRATTRARKSAGSSAISWSIPRA
jgi:transposase